MASGSEQFAGVNRKRKAGTGKPSPAKRRSVSPGSGSRRSKPTMSEIF